MFFSRSAGQKLFSCGDPAAFDFAVGDFTQDSNWNPLDISAQIPINAKWVYCRFSGSTNNVSYVFNFRPAGNSNEVFAVRIQQKVIGTIPDRCFWLPVTSARQIEYSNGGGTWIAVEFSILAWVI